MGLKLAEVYVDIVGRLGPLYSAFNKAKSMVTQFGANMQSLGKRWMGIGAMLGTPFLAGLKAALGFEKQMARVATMLVRTTVDLLPDMAEGIKKLSVQTAKSTQDLTDALYMILSAQVPAAEAMEYLGVAARAAVGGLASTENAVLGLTKMMRTYHTQLKDVSDASDWFFAVVRQGQGTFAEFAQAIPRVAGLAAIAGLAVEELGAAVSTTSRVLANARRATFALASMLSVFLKPTDEAAKIAKKLGFELSTATLRGIGLAGVLKILTRHIEAGTPGIAEMIGRMFPRRAIRALAALLLEFPGYLRDLAYMYDRVGRAEEAWLKISSRTYFKLSQVWAMVKILAIELGTHLIPAFDRFLDRILNLEKPITDWIRGNKQLISGLAHAAVVIFGVGAALYALGTAASIAWAALSAIPILAAGVGLLALGKHLGLIKKDIFELAAGLKLKIGDFFLEDWMRLGWLGIKQIWALGLKWIKFGWDWLMKTLLNIWDWFIGKLKVGWIDVQLLFNKSMNNIVNSIQSGAQKIVAILENTLGFKLFKAAKKTGKAVADAANTMLPIKEIQKGWDALGKALGILPSDPAWIEARRRMDEMAFGPGGVFSGLAVSTETPEAKRQREFLEEQTKLENERTKAVNDSKNAIEDRDKKFLAGASEEKAATLATIQRLQILSGLFKGWAKQVETVFPFLAKALDKVGQKTAAFAKQLLDWLGLDEEGGLGGLGAGGMMGTLFTSPWMGAPKGAFTTGAAGDPVLTELRKQTSILDEINQKPVGLAPGE